MKHQGQQRQSEPELEPHSSPSLNLDLAILFNKILADTKSDVIADIKDLYRFINEIAIQTKEQAEAPLPNEANARCMICGTKDRLERHHLAGEKHDHRIVLACIACHRVLTSWQCTLWNKIWFSRNQPDNIRTAFLILGIRDLLILKTKKTGNSIYSQFAERSIYLFSKLIVQGNEIKYCSNM
jgi:hypothetical protein